MERTSRNNYWSCQHRGLQACLEGPGQAPLSIWTLFIFISLAQEYTALFFSANSTSTGHICWRWAVLPFADQTFRFRFKTYIVFSRQNLFFTCIALRWLNSCLFLENYQPHKWSGILKCFFSPERCVFFSNKRMNTELNLPPLLTIRHVYKKARKR